ncbi:MAG TPA: TetR/AcrR family transcriptional regulator [Solirubrobacteraceae bacterium]
MATRPSRPTMAARYDRKRREVVDAAAQAFAQRGYHATSIDDLVDATGLARGGLYHYIGSKQALLIEVFDVLMAPLLDRAREIAGAGGPAEERLRLLVRVWMAHVDSHRAHMAVFTQERRTLERTPEWERVRADRREFEAILGAILEEGVASGELVIADVALAKLAITGMVNSTPQWFDPERRLSAEQVADGFCDLLLRGIRV